MLVARPRGLGGRKKRWRAEPNAAVRATLDYRKKDLGELDLGDRGDGEMIRGHDARIIKCTWDSPRALNDPRTRMLLKRFYLVVVRS